MLTLFTDSYATLSQIDLLMISFKAWAIKLISEREDLIKAAAQTIDSFSVFTGEKSVSIQPLEFPRNFGSADSVIFNLAAQTKKLVTATYYQCKAFIENIPIGKIDFTQENKRKSGIIGLDPNTRMVLEIYKHDKSLCRY